MDSSDLSMQERVLLAAPRLEALLPLAMERQRALAALRPVAFDLDTLGKRYDIAFGEYQNLKKRTYWEKTEWEEMQQNRFMMRFSQAHREQADKEEEEYIEAAQWEEKAKASLESVRREFGEVADKRRTLQRIINDNDEAEEAVQQIYASVFKGVDVEDPTADYLEDELRSAEKELDDIQGRISFNSSILDNLSCCVSRLGAGRFGACPPGVSRGDAAYRQSLVTHVLTYRNNRGVVEAEGFMRAAQAMDPSIPGFCVPGSDDVRPEEAGPRTASFSDKKWRASVAKLTRGKFEMCTLVEEEMAPVAARIAVLEDERKLAVAAIEVAREKLFVHRTSVFERLMNGDEVVPPYQAVVPVAEDAPPPYE